MNSSDLKDLCLRYLDGDLAGQEAEAFDRLIAGSEEAAKMLARLAIHDSRLESSTTLALSQDQGQSPSHHTMDDALMANQSAAIWDLFNTSNDDKSRPAQSGRMSLRDAGALLGYLVVEAAKTRPAKWLATAAAMALAALIAWQVWGPESSSQLPNQPPQEPLALGPQPAIVASLTAEHNAVWERRPGQDLFVGQRLTLLEGFAEITTNRGAVAIIEAPATLELLDNENAIRLHAGKLVGICETDSSKGFRVRTPRMEIIDLGTWFGVDVAQDDTVVHVLQGEVQAVLKDTASDHEPITLVAGQAVRASADTTVLETFEDKPLEYAALLPVTSILPGTGYGLAAGDIDPNWQIVAVDGKTLSSPQAVRVSNESNYTRFFANDPATSQFIAWKPDDILAPGAFIGYTFQTQVRLPDTFDPGRSRVHVKAMGDNEIAALIVNGNHLEVPQNLLSNMFDQWVTLSLGEQLNPGNNTIQIVVNNHLLPGYETADLVGLRLSWELTSRLIPSDQ